MIGITLDTGALVALERGDKRMRALLMAADQDDVVVTVPAVVLVEWWRSGTARQQAILDSVDVEQLSEQLGKVASEALVVLPGAAIVDVLVMASAAQRGDVVYTSDFEEFERLRSHFCSVRRVLRV